MKINFLNQLLNIEEKEELYQYSFTFNNIMMYPLIRRQLMLEAIHNRYELKITSNENRKYKTIQYLKFIFKCILYRLPKGVKSNILIFDTDLSNIKQGNSYFNRVVDFFANEYPFETIIFEKSQDLNFKRPRSFTKVFVRDVIEITARFKSQFSLIKKEDLQNIDLFTNYIRKYFDYTFKDINVWNRIRKELIRCAKEMSFYYREYVHIFKKISPRIIFLKCACYGGLQYIPLIMAAKDLKIPIGEQQHGMVSLMHEAYNYSYNISNKYKYYLPDFFMSYGERSTENMRLPIKTLNIGNPYLSDIISKYKQEEKKEFLVYISSAVNPQLYNEEVIFLKEMLEYAVSCSVVFRTHPSEKNEIKTVYKPIIDAGIEIDLQPLYDTLNLAKYVIVSGVSTVLYEAALFDCVLFVKDLPIINESIDITPFNIYKSSEEIVERISLNNYKKTKIHDFLTMDWLNRYHELVDSCLS